MPEHDGEISIRLQNVSRSFGGVKAVSDVSLDVPRGHVLSLVGHSGCGKSTLLRIISGVETIDAGRVVLGGRVVDGDGFVEPEVRGVGFVFQDYALFPHLNVRDNILFGLKRVSRAAAAASADDVIRRVGIEHLTDRFPHTLSGGEQQRVALARALAPRPAIVLMDEPFSNLDQGLREKVRVETLALLKSLDTTVVMVTHDPHEALSSGDQVVLMRAGQVIQAGSAFDLYDRPTDAYAAEFFCASSKVAGVRDGDEIVTPLGRFPIRGVPPVEDAATIHLRPQAITVSLDRGTIPARIVHRVFHGETEQMLLQVDGLDAPLRAATRERLPIETDSVTFSIDAERVLMF